MSTPTNRRLTLADLAILIASTAFALFGSRIVRERRVEITTIVVVRDFYVLGMESAPVLLSASMALLIARWINPRPRFHQLACQPGAIACLVIVGHSLLNVAEDLVHGFLWSILKQDYTTFVDSTAFLLHGCWHAGRLVAASWVTLALAGRWRPEPSWIDRSGRVIGVLAILGSLALNLIP